MGRPMERAMRMVLPSFWSNGKLSLDFANLLGVTRRYSSCSASSRLMLSRTSPAGSIRFYKTLYIGATCEAFEDCLRLAIGNKRI